MATIPVPTLSVVGWVRSPAEKADMLFSHFYESEKAQTALYGDNIANLQWLIEEYGSNIVNLLAEMRQAFEKYLSAYYDAVNASVTSNDGIENTNGHITISVHIDVTEEGKTYSFGRLLKITDSKIAQIIAQNNNSNTAG